MGSGPVTGTLYEKTAREQAKRIGCGLYFYAHCLRQREHAVVKDRRLIIFRVRTPR
jgi:hypothetical protein